MGMLGGYGVALGSEIIKKMVEDGHLKPCEEEEGTIEPWEEEEREERIIPSFETGDSDLLYCFSLDTRLQDYGALYRKFGEDLYNKVFRAAYRFW